MSRRSWSYWALGIAAAGALVVAGLAGARSSQTGIHYASRVVIIDRGTVKADLLGISRDDTFKFKRAAGALAKLRKGSVMLLQGAFSHNGFAKQGDSTDRGVFRDVIEKRKVRGPILISHTHNDKAVGVAYPIASRTGESANRGRS